MVPAAAGGRSGGSVHKSARVVRVAILSWQDGRRVTHGPAAISRMSSSSARRLAQSAMARFPDLGFSRLAVNSQVTSETILDRPDYSRCWHIETSRCMVSIMERPKVLVPLTRTEPAKSPDELCCLTGGHTWHDRCGGPGNHSHSCPPAVCANV